MKQQLVNLVDWWESGKVAFKKVVRTVRDINTSVYGTTTGIICVNKNKIKVIKLGNEGFLCDQPHKTPQTSF